MRDALRAARMCQASLMQSTCISSKAATILAHATRRHWNERRRSTGTLRCKPSPRGLRSSSPTNFWIPLLFRQSIDGIERLVTLDARGHLVFEPATGSIIERQDHSALIGELELRAQEPGSERS